ncbi:MAG: hypothetical protein OXH99_13005 [Bryobacterales bacterium]|nr:hypothetical protein [Bryobacterales bacterium]
MWELLATAEAVQARQREGMGQVFVALAFQNPQQWGRQIGPHALDQAGLAQQIPQVAAVQSQIILAENGHISSN